jgi:uncharacterized caspase-like protein
MPEIGGFDDVTTLLNASSDTVRKQIAIFFDQKAPDDLLLLYFSGHGVRDDNGKLYFAVRDSQARFLRASAISASYLSEEMDDTHSKRVVIVLDCCHSGAFGQGMKGVTGESAGTATALEGNGFGRIVLTATDATQYALEGDRVLGNAFDSVFTHFLIEGVKTGEADANADGKITVDELYEYVHDHVVTVNPTQTPCKFTYKQQGDFVIARNRAPRVTAAELPPDVVRAMNSAAAWERCGTVAFLSGWLQSGDRAQVAAARDALTKLAGDDSRQVYGAATEALSKVPVDQALPFPPSSSASRDVTRGQERDGTAPTEAPAPTAPALAAPTPVLLAAAPPAVPTPVVPKPAVQPRSGKAVAALTCSIVGLVLVAIPILALILGGVGFFLGLQAVKQVDASHGAIKGRTLAVWGWVVGLVAIGLGILAFFVNMATYLNYFSSPQ